jgi:hypothetical protein
MCTWGHRSANCRIHIVPAECSWVRGQSGGDHADNAIHLAVADSVPPFFAGSRKSAPTRVFALAQVRPKRTRGRLDKALNIAGFRLLRRPSRQPSRAFLTALSERPLKGIFNSALQMLDLFLCCNSACSPHALQGRPSNRPRTAPRRLRY